MRGLLLAVAALHAAAVAGSVKELPSVALCVAIKDQAADVREWIYYHRAVGAALSLFPFKPTRVAGLSSCSSSLPVQE